MLGFKWLSRFFFIMGLIYIIGVVIITLLDALSLELKQSKYVYFMAKQIQELVAELYPNAENYNETIEEEIKTFSASNE